MKRFLTAATVAGAICAGGMAHAVTFDFEALADTFYGDNGYEAIWEQAVGADGWWEGDGDGTLQIMAGVQNAKPGAPTSGEGYAHAFLDSGNAGIGVCSTGVDTSNATGIGGEMSLCATGYSGSLGNLVDKGDDNVADPEVLELKFSHMAKATFGLVRDANHNLANGTMEIAVDGGSFVTYNVANGVIQGTGNGLKGMTFWLRPDAQGQGYVAKVEGVAVPLPAAGFLLLGAMGGLGIAARRRNKT